MKIKYVLLTCVLMSPLAMFCQEERSKADILFFEYRYREAIDQYQREKNEGSLTNNQLLNLADSYLKIGDYKTASKTYLDVHRRDTTMSAHHFSKMLQAMARTSGTDRVKAFMATKTNSLPPELLENAEFNFSILGKEGEQSIDYNIFNIQANSPQADFSPSFYGDKLLFTSGRPQEDKRVYEPSGEGYLDIYVGRVGLGGQIQNPNPFNNIPVSKFHEATPYFSQELNSIFYIRSNEDKKRLSFDENGKNALAIGLVGGDGNFRFLLRDLSTSFYYPFFESKTEKLYFAANFEDSYGGTDIYFVYTNNGIIMSAPKNLGPTINTPGNEIAPYIFNDSFYYASDVFYGMGGMDIYKSEMLDDEIFSIPINLGKGINSDKDDFGLIIKNNIKEGVIGYFSSNRPGGMGNDDIYGFSTKEKPGLKTLIFRGKVTNTNNGLGIPRVSLKLLDSDNSVLKKVFSRDNGEYRLEVPWVDSVRLQVTKDRYSIVTEDYNKSGLEEIQGTIKNIDLELFEDVVQEKEDQMVLKMNKFFFVRGKYDVTPLIAIELDKAADIIKKFPELKFRIEAHTDSRGGRSTNLRLSQRRADAIKRYLLEKGISSDRITESVGYGEQRITNNCTDGKYCLEILHKQNERQYIVVLDDEIVQE